MCTLPLHRKKWYFAESEASVRSERLPPLRKLAVCAALPRISAIPHENHPRHRNSNTIFRVDLSAPRRFSSDLARLSSFARIWNRNGAYPEPSQVAAETRLSIGPKELLSLFNIATKRPPLTAQQGSGGSSTYVAHTMGLPRDLRRQKFRSIFTVSKCCAQNEGCAISGISPG